MVVETNSIDMETKKRKLSELNSDEKKIAVMALREYEKCGTWTLETFIKHHNLEPTTIEVGKVYKAVSKFGETYLFHHKENGMSYGFFEDEWTNGNWITGNSYWGSSVIISEATEAEWFEALEKEEKLRGFVKGVKFKSLYNEELFESDGTFFQNRLNEFNTHSKSPLAGYSIMQDGIWAEIIDEEKETVEPEETKAKIYGCHYVFTHNCGDYELGIPDRFEFDRTDIDIDRKVTRFFLGSDLIASIPFDTPWHSTEKK